MTRKTVIIIILILLVFLILPLGFYSFMRSNISKMHWDRFVRGKHRYEGSEFCKTCHPKYYEEWRKSLHAQATTEKHFPIRASQMRWIMKTEICYDCHGPLRSRRGEGISCEVCHGPRNTRKVVKNICQGCHVASNMLTTYKEYNESKAKKTGKTCLDCHMPKKEERHLHRFSGSRADSKVYKKVVKIAKVVLEDKKVVVFIKNTVEGHYIPTAAPENIVFLEVYGYNAKGNKVYREELSFKKSFIAIGTMPMFVTADNRLKDGELRKVSFKTSKELAKIRAIIEIRPILTNGKIREVVIDEQEIKI